LLAVDIEMHFVQLVVVDL